MAIVIQQAPSQGSPSGYDIAPAYNDIVYVVDSNNTSQPNFRYLADIYISGVSSFIRMRKPPHPVTDDGIFDVHRIIEKYVTVDIDASTYGFQTNNNSWRQYQIKFGEEYGISSGITQYHDLIVAGSGDIINAAPTFIKWKDYASSDYKLLSSNRSFLTYSPDEQEIFANENAWLHMIQNSSGDVYYGRIISYDSNDALIDELWVINPYTDALANPNGEYLRFGCGTRNLGLIDASLITNGSPPLLPAGTAKYEVTMLNASLAVSSKTKTYVITDACNKFTHYRLHFLNRLGGIDSYTFTMASQTTIEINRSEFKNKVGTATATTFNYAKSDREDTVLFSKTRETIILETDFVSEDVIEWLEELITSPLVFWDSGNDILIAVNIEDTAYERKTHEREKVINMKIKIKKAFINESQRA